MGFIDEKAILAIEQDYGQGLTSGQIIDLCREHGQPLSEASLRKYVQIGLLPRSVRVGEKGKHRGSKGLYPVRIVRLIVLIRELMDAELTIEEIQNEVLFLRSDLDELDERLTRVFERVSLRLKQSSEKADLQAESLSAQAMGAQLLEDLRVLEAKLSGGRLALDASVRRQQKGKERPAQRSRRILNEEECEVGLTTSRANVG